MKIKYRTIIFFNILILLNITTFAHAKDVKVSAVYKVEFSGFDLGKYKFNSQIKDNKYSLNSHTKLSILKGTVMKWKMNMQASGTLSDKGPIPEKFSYKFKGKKKKRNRQLVLEFINGAERKVKVTPPPKESKKRIPIEPKHLQNVFDPMSGLMVLTNTKEKELNRNVCNQTIQLFDGKDRYDIGLKYKKVALFKPYKTSNKKRKSFVCEISYKPIAGHKKKDKTKDYMSKVKGMEVWFAPFKQAHIYVPYKIVVPTPFGTNTTITAKHFQIEKNGQAPIAFIK